MDYENLIEEAERYQRAGDYDQAEERYKAALDVLAKNSTFVSERIMLMRVHHRLGLLYRTQNEFKKAEPHYQRALQLAKDIHGERHPETVERVNYLAALYCAGGRYGESEKLLENSLEFYRQALGNEHEVTAITLYALALVTRRSSQAGAPNVAPVIGGKCKTYYDQAGTILGINLAQLDIENHSDLFRALMRISYDRFMDGKFDEAEELFRHSLLTELNEIWPHHPLVSDAYQILADLYRSFGTPKQSEYLYRKALEIRREVYGSNHEKTAATAQTLALLLLDEFRATEAEELFALARDAYRYSPFQPLFATALRDHARALQALGKNEEAQAERKQAERIMRDFGMSSPVPRPST